MTDATLSPVERLSERHRQCLRLVYGIERKGMHVAGNDALITLKVALAMAATEPELRP